MYKRRSMNYLIQFIINFDYVEDDCLDRPVNQISKRLVAGKCCQEQLFGQLVESNLLKATCCLWQLSSNFCSTCWKQLVESNLLPVATFEQLLVNMLLSTCWKQLVARGNIGATFGQQVAFNMLNAICCLRQLLGNKSLSTSCFQHVARKLP